jgi:hypothetical protein
MIIGHKHITEAMLFIAIWIGRGAFQRHRSQMVMFGGVSGKANVGISNDKGGEKPPRRKTKAS